MTAATWHAVGGCSEEYGGTPILPRAYMHTHVAPGLVAVRIFPTE